VGAAALAMLMKMMMMMFFGVVSDGDLSFLRQRCALPT